MEGDADDCNDAWAVIKGWNWKKINVKIQEEDDNVESWDDLDKMKRFEGFEEIGFVKNSEQRDYHMDMGEFFKFLKAHQSEYMFKELFGIDKS